MMWKEKKKLRPLLTESHFTGPQLKVIFTNKCIIFCINLLIIIKCLKIESPSCVFILFCLTNSPKRLDI